MQYAKFSASCLQSDLQTVQQKRGKDLLRWRIHYLHLWTSPYFSTSRTSTDRLSREASNCQYQGLIGKDVGSFNRPRMCKLMKIMSTRKGANSCFCHFEFTVALATHEIGKASFWLNGVRESEFAILCRSIAHCSLGTVHGPGFHFSFVKLRMNRDEVPARRKDRKRMESMNHE